MSSSDTRRQLRDDLVDATLPHIAFDGCTARALVAGAVTAGLPEGTAERAFPGGMVDFVGHWSDLGDRRATTELARRDVQDLRMSERVATAVRTRIEVENDHREAVRRAVAFLALPPNVADGTRYAWRSVDSLWYACGDTATDFTYYTKRALLAPVYTATVLYWLADESEDNMETWGFLNRRLGDVMQIPKLQNRFAGPLRNAGESLERVLSGRRRRRRRGARAAG